MKKIMLTIILILIAIYILLVMFFYFKQESILFHPAKTVQDYTYNFPVEFKENFYKTPHNGKIHSLRFTVENSTGIVLYLHGNAGNLKDWAWVYQQYTSRNYDVEIIDYRTYGKSTGVLSESNMHSDVLFVYNELKKSFEEKNIIIHGRSIGTGMASELCLKNNPKALILESPYYNILDIAKRMLPFLPVKLLLKYRFNNYKNLQDLKLPIYILHGKKDGVIPFDSGLKLYHSKKENSSFIEFENGTHSNLATFEKYQLFLDGLLKGN